MKRIPLYAGLLGIVAACQSPQTATSPAPVVEQQSKYHRVGEYIRTHGEGKNSQYCTIQVKGMDGPEGTIEGGVVGDYYMQLYHPASGCAYNDQDFDGKDVLRVMDNFDLNTGKEIERIFFKGLDPDKVGADFIYNQMIDAIVESLPPK